MEKSFFSHLNQRFSLRKCLFVESAYAFARKAHENQKRLTGDSFILHPLAVASITFELQQDVVVLMAAFLHDVVEDTPITIKQIQAEFGNEIAFLVDGVTKVCSQPTRPERQVATLKKLIKFSQKDPRVITLKLADRLHNLRTSAALSNKRRARLGQETLQLYVPLLNHVPVPWFQDEFMQLTNCALHPIMYEEVRQIWEVWEQGNYIDSLRKFVKDKVVTVP